jgi:hypothetical protein
MEEDDGQDGHRPQAFDIGAVFHDLVLGRSAAGVRANRVGSTYIMARRRNVGAIIAGRVG